MRVAPLVTVVALAASFAVPASGAPVCTDPIPQAACGDRVIADPLLSGTFIQYGSEAWPALDAIEKIAPDVIEVRSLAEWTRNKKYVSTGGRQIPVIRITDEKKPRKNKRVVVVSLSVHGNEPAGREGGLRYAETLARWWKGDK